MQTFRERVALMLCALAWAAQAAPERAGVGGTLGAAATPPGAYDARLCVSVSAGEPRCGTVLADVQGEGRVRVQVSDIVYRLDVMDDRLGVSLFHGTMQIDGFFARYQWDLRTLRFSDPDKDTRYQLVIGARRFDRP